MTCKGDYVAAECTLPTASIAMCVYNGERFLREQLASLVAQSVKPYELVVCDDKSSDESLTIIRKFAETAPFTVHIYENIRNLGYVKNFEKATQLCSGDIVFLCDQDDVWHPQKIERCVSAFQSEPDVGLVLHDFNWVDERGAAYPGPIERYGEDKLLAADLPQAFKRDSIEVFMLPYPRAWCGCMMAFRRLFVSDIVPIFPGKGHDDWILKLLAAISQVRFLDQVLIDYRIHSTNVNGRDVSQRTWSYRWNRFLYKANRVFKGHSKRAFYKQLLLRLGSSKHAVRYPRLVDKYRLHADGR